LHIYDTAIILNQQSLDKFEPKVKSGGVLLYDSNGITRHPERNDINIYRIDATEEAARMKSTRTMNMIVLGGYLKIKPIVEMENVLKGLKESLPERHHHFLPMNERAIQRGMEIVREVSLVT
jgi:2-oxoglutarate ferredoxin oxidoreductase subunit gamma